MLKKFSFLLLFFIECSLLTFSQQVKVDSTGGYFFDKNNVVYKHPSTANPNLIDYELLMKANTVEEFTSPVRWKGTDWSKVAGFILVETSVAAFADKHAEDYILQLRNNWTLNNITNQIDKYKITRQACFLAVVGSSSFLFHDKKLRNTTVLAAQAFLIGGGTALLLNFLTGRNGPLVYDPNTYRHEVGFRGPFTAKPADLYGHKYYSSFPSVNSTVSFAIATVFANDYQDKKFIPILAYGAASVISINDLLTNKHWVSDILAGQILGYFTGKLVVRNARKFFLFKSLLKTKPNVQAQMSYSFGRLRPGLTYTF